MNEFYPDIFDNENELNSDESFKIVDDYRFNENNDGYGVKQPVMGDQSNEIMEK